MRHAYVFALLLAFAAPSFAQDAPIPRKDDQWTILCTTLPGPDRIRQARDLRMTLARSTRMPGWYVVQGETESTLYYGYYRTIDARVDSKESARIKSDLRKIQELAEANGE